MLSVKSMLIFFLLLPAAGSLLAQSLSFGLAAGPTLSDLRVKAHPVAGDFYDSKFGILAEANLTWRLPKVLGLRAGLGYERKGGRTDITFTDENGNPVATQRFKAKLDYLQLPVMLELRFGQQLQLLVDVGASFGLLVNQQEKDLLYPGNHDFDRTDVSALAGAGFEFPLSEALHLQILARMAYGLKDVDTYATIETKNISYVATLGIQYFLN